MYGLTKLKEINETYGLYKCNNCGKELPVKHEDVLTGKKKSCGCKRYRPKLVLTCVNCGTKFNYEIRGVDTQEDIICKYCIERKFKNLI